MKQQTTVPLSDESCDESPRLIPRRFAKKPDRPEIDPDHGEKTGEVVLEHDWITTDKKRWIR
ncbi:hypothetical protein A2318_00655 [Candidatus Uhrbacteria bacterium RIFOXYB2_FULL_45_11]|uniref:Uncharacterized protein n=1 Tax=Candidatus Uhrbacteria bacterium RIFOXYB2_FULL_45_11 TaxID=1802421 RepID=A0A1F7W116_9BACT|nr:MAG: hypothetical protein A2318_00655 [Candidatus Uhrbacteria bacterium RIFOXYB2_FULL_45_11]